ncbi:MAG: alpha/beta hydrolase [Gemmatimonadetes bacterium]|nr:alpha/beta hydrolase [Gemmatimonadota bacterium]
MPILLLAALSLAAPDSGRSYHVSVSKAESLFVTESGEGQPVVLIPGLFGSAYGYRKVLPLLVENGYRAIVVEPLGIGFSGRPERADYSLTAQADRIAMTLERLDARGAIVVAHSVGASIAYRLAYRHPELVRGIVSLEGGTAESVMTPGTRAAMRFIPWVKWFGGMKLIRKRIRKSLIETGGDTAWVTDEVVQAYTAGAAVNLDETLKSLLAMSAAKEPEKLKPHLAEVQAPVLLLVGGASKGGAPGAEIALLRSSLASFRVDTIAGSGLFVQEERPEAVLGAVQRVTS